MRRAAALALLTGLLLLPSPAFADEAGGGAELNVPLLAIGGGAVVIGAALWIAKKGGRWAGPAIVGVGVLLLATGAIAPRLTDAEAPEDAAVSFVEPRDGATVDAGEPTTVRVDLHGATIATSPTDEDGGHIHIYVKGEL